VPVRSSIPLVTGPGGHHLGDLRLEGRPLRSVVLGSELVRIEAQPFEHLSVELGLDGPKRDPLTVGALVDVVEMGACVEQVHAALRLVET